MRDAFLLAVLPILLFYILRSPFIGLGLWIWTAMFFPNGWVYGAASNIRYNLLFAGLTLVVYLISKDKSKLQLGSIGILVLLFFLWTTLSTVFGLALPDIAWDFWTRLLKIVTLFLFVLLIVDKKLHIDFFIWCLMLSVGFYACVEGLKYIASGGGHILQGMPGHVIGDRNDLALALAMLLPLSFYLLGEYGKRSLILRIGLLGAIALIVTSIIGTNSRGGLVALAAVGGYLFLKSKRKLLFLFLMITIGSLIFSVIPEQWYSRMDTIANADEDASFMGRIVAWKLSFILAVQHPLLGGGFKALESFPVWLELSKEFSLYPYFYSGNSVPDIHAAHAAHSIYFQVLGDHGFIGLLLFVSILGLSFSKAGHIASKARILQAPNWFIQLATMLRLSIFAYAVGGAALSFAYFDMIYSLYGLVIVMDKKILHTLTELPKSA
jgi:probable O-glycosylation ligase (exosortase A-associated)